MKKDLIDYIAEYIMIGTLIIILFIGIVLIIDNFMIFLKIITLLFCVGLLGFIVVESFKFFSKKIKNRISNKHKN